MIKAKKRGLSRLFVFAVFVMVCLSGCSTQTEIDTDINEVEYVDSTVRSTAVKNVSDLRTVKTAVIQYDSSKILDECCEGVQRVFDESGIGYDVFVGESGDPLGSCLEYANNVVINGGYDAVLTIGTGAADDVYSALRTASNIPVVFCAPDEPITNSFAQRINSSSDKCYGIAITQNLAQAQFDMINSFQSSVTELGVVYLNSDVRSQQYLAALEKKCKSSGVTLFKEGAADVSELVYAIENLSDQVQAITLLPENSLENDMDRISQKALSENIPLYGTADINASGKFPASVCYDYEQMGEDSAEILTKLMFGGDMSDTQSITIAYAKVYGNARLLEGFDIDIPESYTDRFVQTN